MYDSITTREKTVIFLKNQQKKHTQDIYLIDTYENSNCTIDEVIGNHLKEKIHTITKNKQRFQSFIAKYVYEGVDDEIDKSPSAASNIKSKNKNLD